jgi:hypothetical protein
MGLIDLSSVRGPAGVCNRLGFDIGLLQGPRDGRGLRRTQCQTAERGDARQAKQAIQECTSIHKTAPLISKYLAMVGAQRINAPDR